MGEGVKGFLRLLIDENQGARGRQAHVDQELNARLFLRAPFPLFRDALPGVKRWFLFMSVIHQDPRFD